MKFKKMDFFVVIILFIISLSLVTTFLVHILYSYSDENERFKKTNITKTELALALYGKPLPDSKLQAFNSLGDHKIDNNKDKITDYIKMYSILLIPSIILTAFLSRPYFSFKNSLERGRKKRAEDLLKKNYNKKYSINEHSYIVQCIDSSSYNKEITNKSLIAWKENNIINFVNSDYTDDIGILKINLNDITCFSRFGDFYTTSHINGGDSSYSRAALGYLLAGPAGAIISSRNPVSGETMLHDNRETLLFINKNNEEKFVFFEPKFYDFLIHIIPNKEINHKMNTEAKINSDDKLEKLRKLGDLKEKGYINSDEFDKLKSELISNV